MAATSDSILQTVSTTSVPERDRLPLWGEYVWKHIGKLKSDAFGDIDFDGTLDYADVGSMKIARICAGRHRVQREPQPFTDSVVPYVKVAVQIKGCSIYEQHGRSMRLQPGQWSAYDTARPYVVSNPEAVEQLAFLIPHDQIARDIDIARIGGRAFSGTTGIGRLFVNAVSSLFEELPVLDPRRAEDLAEVAVRLFHIAVYEKLGKPQPQSTQEEMLDRIRIYVENRLRDPRLTLDRIATDLNCTKRYLHLVFQGQEQTLNEYIWTRRLERCKRDLTNPALAGTSVTSIAMSWGFNNPSHFSRAFRDRFGLSPREARAQALAALRPTGSE
jgi:AraC-like DNA-binding protein